MLRLLREIPDLILIKALKNVAHSANKFNAIQRYQFVFHRCKCCAQIFWHVVLSAEKNARRDIEHDEQKGKKTHSDCFKAFGKFEGKIR